MSQDIFNKNRDYRIETHWRINPVVLLAIFYICAISLVVMFTPGFAQLGITGIKLAVFVIAISVLLSIFTPIFSALADLTSEWLVRKLPDSNLESQTVITNTDQAGAIYLVKRSSDGIYKIGKTRDFKMRLNGLIREYGEVESIAVWEVPNRHIAEKIAHRITARYRCYEKFHRELFKMADTDVLHFFEAFNRYVDSQDGILRHVTLGINWDE